MCVCVCGGGLFFTQTVYKWRKKPYLPNITNRSNTQSDREKRQGETQRGAETMRGWGGMGWGGQNGLGLVVEQGEAEVKTD